MSPRKTNPSDIMLPEGYTISVFAEGLTTPINLTYTDGGEMLVADAGVADGNGKVLKLTGSGTTVLADGFHPPLTGITYHRGDIYVAHRGFITKVGRDGSKEHVLAGLPSMGDHHNNRVVFGPDGKMYFGQGTATNSGVVGTDNRWVQNYPYFHDYPGTYIRLSGQNFRTDNVLTESAHDYAETGGFSPFGIATAPNEWVKGVTAASGSILRANPDGSQLELVAWGLRNPFRMKFDRQHRLYATNHGMDDRGSRPVGHCPDEFHIIQHRAWYGWPDYAGGVPVTLPQFMPENKQRPSFLLAEHPMTPPRPAAVFEPHSAIMGFDINYSAAFGPAGDVFIAEFGSEAPRTTGGKPEPRVGHRVSRIDMRTGRVIPFAINRSGVAASQSGEGGFERPIDAVFGSERDLLIVDFGMAGEEGFVQHTGVIWKISRR
ncbi:hypothetical protein SD70_04060 [Gordoniibacillus kamchatkensis]|uniref:Glucose/Sorbosone dehydrogenase domain-containing protein n=1 Tax=Gordoniibacillus kamchatkensis TaxID=1590651 RepID=A0ABR5AL82_9BACL|nr:PQQ-dependent sugar dehydrogenase [Paenibacillus sp. VKM B-2647]KIL41807.1 hypothetical protein SD70_04060 [Paenibacillus sp. VKM B-2647]